MEQPQKPAIKYTEKEPKPGTSQEEDIIDYPEQSIDNYVNIFDSKLILL